MFLKVLGAAVIFIVGLMLLAVLIALPVMLLWNALMPDITRGAVTEIGFLQALGLTMLTSMLVNLSKSNSSMYLKYVRIGDVTTTNSK